MCTWCLTVSCGEAEPEANSEVTAPNPSGDDDDDHSDDLDQADASDAADTPPDPQTGTCEGVHEELGVLATDAPTVVSRTLEMRDGERASCAAGGEGGGEYVFAFEVAEAAILETAITATTADGITYSLFEGGCSAQAEVYCSDRSPWRAMVEPDTTYYLKVQAGENTPGKTFNASFDFDEAICTPTETTCSEGMSHRCIQGTSTEPYSCAGACSDQERCAGDECQAALVVEPVAGGDPVVIEGERWAYSHQWNAADLASCETSSPIETGETTAMELFLRVPDLEAGQTLDISRGDDSGSYLYYVLDDCGADTCRESMFVDDDGDNRLVWEVPDDGDYVVVVEALSNTSRTFHLEAAVR